MTKRKSYKDKLEKAMDSIKKTNPELIARNSEEEKEQTVEATVGNKQDELLSKTEVKPEKVDSSEGDKILSQSISNDNTSSNQQVNNTEMAESEVPVKEEPGETEKVITEASKEAGSGSKNTQETNQPSGVTLNVDLAVVKP